jgi:hypothetical protein
MDHRVTKPGMKVKTVQDRREQVKNRRVHNRQEKYHRLGLEESPVVISKETKKKRALVDATNRPPFITAVPVGRFVQNDQFEELFVFQGSKRKDETPVPKLAPKKKKSPHRPPFILSTRRSSIVSVNSIPRLVTTSSLKKRNTKVILTKVCITLH